MCWPTSFPPLFFFMRDQSFPFRARFKNMSRPSALSNGPFPVLVSTSRQSPAPALGPAHTADEGRGDAHADRLEEERSADGWDGDCGGHMAIPPQNSWPSLCQSCGGAVKPDDLLRGFFEPDGGNEGWRGGGKRTPVVSACNPHCGSCSSDNVSHIASSWGVAGFLTLAVALSHFATIFRQL